MKENNLKRKGDGDGKKVDEDIVRTEPQEKRVREGNPVNGGSVEKKRRRMSRKERKALKQIKKHKECKSENEESVGITSNVNVDPGVDENVEAEEERTRLECMKSYCAIDMPKEPSAELASKKEGPSSETQLVDAEGGCRTLGKWFPNAIVMKTISYTNTGQLILDKKSLTKQLHSGPDDDMIVKNPRSCLVLFYQYTTCDDGGDDDNNMENSAKTWDRRQLQILITYLSKIARHRNIGGRIRVAPEGVNATLSAVDTKNCSAKAALRHLAEDLRRFDQRVFSQTDFKFLDDLPADRHFKEIKILPVQELVFYDIGEDDAPLTAKNRKNIAKMGGGGIHLDAKEYHEMLQKDNTVVIDVRNNYETILGRFDGQQQQQQDHSQTESNSKHLDKNSSSHKGGGAEYIDPKMRKSTDFKSWLATPETQEKLSNKTVLMYCTGGIRCERASAYLKSQMGDHVEGVYQLKGGIERYLKTFKDGGFWRGKNFVFDKREAISADNPHGDGGVVRKKDRKNQKRKRHNHEDEKNNALLAKCCVCGDPWDRYVGKKKCLTCGVPVLMCEKCMSLKPDKTPGMELKVRCQLCVEENITVLAKELELTANGIKNKVATRTNEVKRRKKGSPAVTGIDSLGGANTMEKEKRERNKICQTAKAANSVLKWGGGHAIGKKTYKKNSRRLCQFGANCFRKDCFFYHPEREVT